MLRFLPILSTAVIIPFAYIGFQRWIRTRSNPSLLIWGFGLTFYAIGTFTGSLYSIFGWDESWGELNLRIWYLFGAILVAAWLGQGTVFLLWRRIAKPTMIILAIASIYGIYAVFTAPIDPSPLIDDAPELTGKDVFPMSVRLLTPFFNIYGVVTLVGGALWSALFYYRRRTEPNRMTGNLLIAGGAILIAIGGSLNRFGFEGLNVTELASAILLFWGFVLVSQRQASGSADSSADSTVTSSV